MFHTVHQIVDHKLTFSIKIEVLVCFWLLYLDKTVSYLNTDHKNDIPY